MRWLLALCLVLLPVMLRAQDQATLVADSVAISGRDVLIAEGNVEVFYGGRHLMARRITFDAATDRLKIEGPITVTDADGADETDEAPFSLDL